MRFLVPARVCRHLSLLVYIECIFQIGISKFLSFRMDVLSSPSPRPGVIVSTKDCKRNLLPKGENTFLYAESKRARMEREKVGLISVVSILSM